MAELGPELVREALAGDGAAVNALVDALTPVIQARVARALLRRQSAARGRNVRQEVEDLAQEVFLALFASDGKALRAWDPARGLSLLNFAGLLAERQVASILRSGRRSPWTEDPTLNEELDGDPDEGGDPEGRAASREMFGLLLARLREELSPQGLHLFQQLLVAQRPVQEVCAETGMTANAVYAWKSRLGKLVRKLAKDIVSDSPPISRTPSGGE